MNSFDSKKINATILCDLLFIFDKSFIFANVIKYGRYGNIGKTALFGQNREVSWQRYHYCVDGTETCR